MAGTGTGMDTTYATLLSSYDSLKDKTAEALDVMAATTLTVHTKMYVVQHHSIFFARYLLQCRKQMTNTLFFFIGAIALLHWKQYAAAHQDDKRLVRNSQKQPASDMYVSHS